MVLTAHLMYELQLREQSAMWVWLKLWPENPSSLQYFNLHELEGLQDIALYNEFLIQESSLVAIFMKLRTLTTVYPNIFPAKNFTYASFKRASILIATRYFNTDATIKLPSTAVDGAYNAKEWANPLPARPWLTGVLATVECREQNATFTAMFYFTAGQELAIAEVMIPILDMINHGDL